MDKLRQKRLEAGLTQVELAEKCNIRQTTLSSIENGKAEGSIKLAKKICLVLGCKLDDLISLKGD